MRFPRNVGVARNDVLGVLEHGEHEVLGGGVVLHAVDAGHERRAVVVAVGVAGGAARRVVHGARPPRVDGRHLRIYVHIFMDVRFGGCARFVVALARAAGRSVAVHLDY